MAKPTASVTRTTLVREACVIFSSWHNSDLPQCRRFGCNWVEGDPADTGTTTSATIYGSGNSGNDFLC